MADDVAPITPSRLRNVADVSNISTNPDEYSSSEDAEYRRGNMQKDISWEEIAVKLLKDKFLLTALELHAELLESGLELPRLRDYFSNPGNFERSGDVKAELSPGLPRTLSIQTFDSLDFARYSDDGDRQADERVAVLEFELRKARETIKSLRANLTEAAESEATTPESYMNHYVVDDPIKPHEKRALNFLVNEYLLKYNFKLTSITFSDENEDQDFEDWDDVGLNVPKPPPLLLLYRDVSRQFHPCGVSSVEIGVQVDFGELPDRQNWLNETPAELEVPSVGSEYRPVTAVVSDPVSVQRALYFADDASSEHSSDDVTRQNVQHPNARANAAQIVSVQDDVEDNADVGLFENPVKSAQGNDSLNDMLDCDWLLPNLDSTVTNQSRTALMPTGIAGVRQGMPSSFLRILLDLCRTQKAAALDNRLAVEVSEIVDSMEKVVLMLARCLPHIVPNVILAKREELIPVILCTISLHPNSRERDKLLNILFNLIKRPDDDQRTMILTGFVAIAQFMGPTRVEGELLPQCWEQISHKYPERRLLVAEACGILIPYIPNEIRSSLVLSMLQQMLVDDKSSDVREAVIKSLAVLFTYVDDVDKYPQGAQLLMLALHDSSEKVVAVTLQLFLPSFAAWARSLDRFETDLIVNIVKTLQEKIRAFPRLPAEYNPHATLSAEEESCVNLINALQALLPWMFVSVLESVPRLEKGGEKLVDGYALDIGRFPSSISPLCDICVIVGDENRVASLVDAYESYIDEEWYETWPEFEWLLNTFLSLLATLIDVGLSCQPIIHSLSTLFYWICRMFGRHFTSSKVKPLFTSTLKSPGEDLDVLFGKNVVTQSVVPVYACGVLVAFNHDDDRAELTTFLQELLSMLSLWHLPLDGIKVTFVELRSNVLFHDIVLSVLWDGVMHTSALVRCSAASLFQSMVGYVSDALLSTKVAPALVTLAHDPEISVRIATVQTFGAILESTTQKDLLAKAQMQLQTFLDDAIYKDHYALHQEIIRMFGRVAPNCEPRFRDEFVLPHLVALASHNNRLSNAMKRTEIARALLDTYVAVSCCFISDELICDLVIPGLRCLHYDIQQLAPEHEEAVIAMVHEFESKIAISRLPDRSNSVGGGMPTTSMDDVRNRVSKMFTKTSGRPNMQSIFQLKKK